jgi:hypothetical protein
LVDSKEAADPGPYPFKCPSEVKLTAKLPAGTNNNNFLSYNDVPPTTSEDADAYYATIDPRAEVGLGTLLKSEVTPNDVAQVTGVGTNFGTFFNRDGGDIIRAAGQVRTIIRIESDTILRINSPFNPPIVANTQYEKVGEKTTFLRWKAKNGFPEQGNEGEDASAIYFNAGDLGFGRSMHMKRLSAANIAYYVSNYPTVDDARQDTNRIATVAMEYSAVVPNGQRFTKFYVFNNDNNGNKNDGVRVNQADLDNNGGKFVPTLCITCHGGRKGTPKDGVYPLDGNVGAHFLPFDLESYRYSELLTRAAQEAAFKKLNVTLLETEPVTSFAIKNLVDGWYGGSAHPRNDADSSFVPDGWRTPTDKSLLYNAVVKTSCRSCHIARADLSLDWRVFDNGTPSGFKRNTTIPFLVDEIDVLDGFFKLKMPQSKLTYQNHWFSTSPHHRPATLRFERAIAVDPISGLVTTRMGGIATFTVTLMTNPTSDVTIAVTSSNTAEGTVSPATLVFTHQDQAINSPQTLKVTITGVNDPNPGDVAYKILLDKATSADPFYNGMKPQDVNVINK